jgi:hypothetical protein
MKNNDQNKRTKKSPTWEPFKDVLDNLIKSKRRIFYPEAFFLHLEQQKPTENILRTGLAEKEQVRLFGLAFFINSRRLDEAFFTQLEQQTP